MDINHSLNSTIDYIDGGSLNLFKNPIWVAIIITFIILIIIVSIYEEDKLVKTGIYIFLSNLLITFLHNKLLLKEYEGGLMTEDQKNIIGGIDNMQGAYNIQGEYNTQEKTGASDLEYLI